MHHGNQIPLYMWWLKNYILYDFVLAANLMDFVLVYVVTIGKNSFLAYK